MINASFLVYDCHRKEEFYWVMLKDVAMLVAGMVLD